MSAERTPVKGMNLQHVLAIVSIVFTVGMGWGVFKNLPDTMAKNQEKTDERLEKMDASLSTLNTQVVILQNTSVQGAKDLGEIKGQVKTLETSDSEQWAAIRDTQAEMRSKLSREDFLRWQADHSIPQTP